MLVESPARVRRAECQQARGGADTDRGAGPCRVAVCFGPFAASKRGDSFGGTSF
jgi:hypothetical protein